MANAIYSLTAFIVGCYLLRWGYLYIIKRQRIDMTSERKQFQQHAERALRINKRVARQIWKLSGWRPK